MTNGLFLTFEGIDGSGKSTQLQMLAERLRAEGREVVITVEPGGTEIGTRIREILLDKKHAKLAPTAELLLYFAARAQNVAERIRPAVERGAVVLCDRFTDSTLAYQGAGRGLGADVVRQLHRIACGTTVPDATFLIDVTVEESYRRTVTREEDRMDAQGAEFRRAVRDAYLALAAAEPRIRLIDGAGTPEEVHWRIRQAVAALG